jgi:hypothetical protein
MGVFFLLLGLGCMQGRGWELEIVVGRARFRGRIAGKYNDTQD